MTFSQRLDALCKEAGTTATRLGIDLGYSKSTGSLWKNSAGLPRNGTLKKIATYFNMTVDELLEDVDSPIDRGNAMLSAQETELLNAFRKLSVMKQAQLLVKADELLDSESKKS